MTKEQELTTKTAADHKLETKDAEVKTNIKNPEEAKASGIEVVGDPDAWKLLAKASNKKMMKSTKVLNISTGCIVQVSTLYLNDDGSKSVAEALQFVPGCHIDTRGEFPAILSFAEVKL